MALSENSLSKPILPRFDAVRDAFVRFVGGVKKRHQYRQEYKMLVHYDDHLLRDIGLTRDDVSRLLSSPEDRRPDQLW